MIRNILIGSVAVLAIAAVAERALVKPVLAQVRAALIQNIDEPGRTAFALHGSASNSNAFFFSVPANQRYVVETYTGQCFDTAPSTITDITLAGTTNGVPVRVTVQPHLQQANGTVNGHAESIYIGTGSQHLYADPGSSLGIFGDDSNAGAGLQACEFWITGHAISNP